MKKLILGIVIALMGFGAKGQVNCNCVNGSFVSNGNFETGTIAPNVGDNIAAATGWNPLFNGASSKGEYLTVGSNKMAAFWIQKSSNKKFREGIQTQLISNLTSGNKFCISFKLYKTSVGTNAPWGTRKMAVYGVKTGGSIQTFTSSNTPTNLNLYGATNTVKLATFSISPLTTAGTNYSAISTTVPFNVDKVFIAYDDDATGGGIYVGLDDFAICKTKDSKSIEISAGTCTSNSNLIKPIGFTANDYLCNTYEVWIKYPGATDFTFDNTCQNTAGVCYGLNAPGTYQVKFKEKRTNTTCGTLGYTGWESNIVSFTR